MNQGRGGADIDRKDGTINTLAAFREATMELDNVYSLFSKGCGLSEAEYWSLLLIYEGVVTQSEISDQLFLSRQTLNSAFGQLRKKGLIRLEPYEDNQRSKQAILTETGERFVEDNVLKMHKVEEKAWKQMNSQEQETLIRLVRKFSDSVRRELKDL